MSPRWAEVAGYGLYFYFAERHRRPHVSVLKSGDGATVDLVTGEVLAGELPPAAQSSPGTPPIAQRRGIASVRRRFGALGPS